MSEAVRVIAHLKAREGKEDALQHMLEGMIAPTHAEPGCMHYELWQDADDATRFTFVETWRDEAALDRHFETEHIKDALEHFPDLLEGDLDLRRHRFIAGGTVAGG